MNVEPYTAVAYFVGLGMIAAYLLSLTWQWLVASRRGGGESDHP